MNQAIIPMSHGCLVLVIETFEFRVCFEFRYSDFEFPAAARADCLAIPVTGKPESQFLCKRWHKCQPAGHPAQCLSLPLSFPIAGWGMVSVYQKGGTG
jgi:hypothetical protein